jgi:DNA-binding NarL/FixJ family response regulator
MDLKLPKLDGVEAMRRILGAQPEAGIIVLTGTDVEEDVVAALQAGALGYLTKTSRREDFLAAIRQVSQGEAWLPPRLTHKLLSHFKPQAARRTQDALTGRESEVLLLLAHGKSNRSIARELVIGEVTVRTHVSHILDKLGVSNRVEAALHALRTGLVPLETSRHNNR